MSRVGIPRAMLYYKYFPMWSTFLREMGAEIVVSGRSNQQTLLHGSSRLVSDTCLPIKIFIGHVVSLIGKCDCILIPVVRAMDQRALNCSRILGLPDLSKAVVPEIPPILQMEFDVNRGRKYLYEQIYTLGKHFSLDPFKIRAAALRSWEINTACRDLMIQEKLTCSETIDLLENSIPLKPRVTCSGKGRGTKIGLIGHPYMLQDEQINHRLLERLRQYDVEVLTPEMLTPGQLYRGMTGIVSGRYWDSEEAVIGAGGFYIGNRVDGIIGVTAFGCGPDSLMMYLVQEQAHRTGVPYLGLTIEEHTAEAGVVTRLEAFLDMICQQKRGINKLCVSHSPI